MLRSDCAIVQSDQGHYSLLTESVDASHLYQQRKNTLIRLSKCVDSRLHLIFAVHIWDINKTCLYNFDSLKPHFYIVKLGFTGVYIIFLISDQTYRVWVLVRTASPRRFNEYPQSMFRAEI